MRTAAVAFLISMILAALLTPLVRRLALAHGWLDQAMSSRKIHGRPVPRLGGVAIVLGFAAPILMLRFISSPMGERLWGDAPRVWALLGGGLAIALLGLYDDLRGTGALKKLVVQAGVAAFLWWAGFRVETLASPFGVPLEIGLLSLPITVLWICGVVNAMNLIDGLDGLAGGVALFALGASFTIAFVRGEVTMALLSAALGGGVLGFLFYNWNPASIFMGDTGSMFLGYVLAAGSILTQQKSSTAVALLVPIVALGLPIADTLLAITRRALRGRPIFSADREHIHHKLLALGLSPRQAVLVLWGAAALLGGSALVVSFANSVSVAATLCTLALVGFISMRRLGYLRGTDEKVAELRQKNLALRKEARAIARALTQAQSLADLFGSLTPLRALVAASRLALELEGREALTDGGAEDGYTARLQISGERVTGALALTWSDGRTNIDRDEEIACEVLCDHLATELDRLTPPAAAKPTT